MADKNYGHTDVAPADSGASVNRNDEGERIAHEDGRGEGVQPIVGNPDQPTFPRPFGVSDDDLRASGAGHGYQGVGTEDQVKAAEDDRAFVDVEDEGEPRPASEPEGKPRDPDEAEKQKAAADVAKQAQHPKGQHAQTQQKQ